MSTPGTAELWASLHAKGLVQGERPARSRARAPWYVRLMLGIAGWVGAWFLLGFVSAGFTFVLQSATASYVAGALVCAAATLLFRVRAESDFMSQFGFAVSLAGQALLVWGLIGWFLPATSGIAIAVSAQQALLFILIPSFVHRVWAAASAMVAFVYALGELQLAAYAPAFVSAGFAWTWLTELERPTLGTLRRAAGYGLAIALALVMTGREAHWVLLLGAAGGADHGLLANAMLALVLILAAVGLLKREGVALGSRRGAGALLGAGLLAAAALKAPGLAPGVLILVLGFANGNRVLAGFGAAALAAYLSYYYYALHATLLEKSALLAATGVALLLARVAIRRAWDAEAGHA